MTLIYLNRCAFVPVAFSSANDFAVNTGAPVTGFYAPSACAHPAVVDAATYHYFAESADRTQHEEGEALWDNATSTLLRATGTVRNSTNAGSRVTFSAAPTVYMGGPAGSDVAFRGFETLTTSASPITISADVYASYVTTDGSGLARTLNLPSSLADKDDGLLHIIVMVAQPNFLDTIVCSDADYTFTLGQYVGQFVTLRWSGNNFIWEIVAAGGTVITPPKSASAVMMVDTGGEFVLRNVTSIFTGSSALPFNTLNSNASGAIAFNYTEPNDVLTWETLTTGASPHTLFQTFYNTRITSGGTAGAEAVTIDNGSVTGQRLLVTFTTQTNPADVISFTTTNILFEGNTPTTVQLNAQGDKILVEWTGTAWDVIDVSAGVVTPSDPSLRGYESLTTGASPVTINPQVFASYITTDGTGTTQTLSLPVLDEKSEGLEHLVLMVNRVHASDRVECTDSSIGFTLVRDGDPVLLRWSGVGFQWDVIDSNDSYTTPQTNPSVWTISKDGQFLFTETVNLFNGAVLLSGAYRALQSDINGALSFTSQDANNIYNFMPANTGAFTRHLPFAIGAIYNQQITSGGTAGAENVIFDAGLITGNRMLVSFTTQTNPADVIAISVTNIVQGGVTPTTVQLNAAGDEILVEWWGTAWNVIFATAGVVTP